MGEYSWLQRANDHLTKGLYIISALALLDLAGEMVTTAFHYLVVATVKTVQCLLPLEKLFKLLVTIFSLKICIKILYTLDVRWPLGTDGHEKTKEEFISRSYEELPCLVCNQRSRSVVLMPCRHMCICRPCSVIFEASGSKCPKCRVGVRYTFSSGAPLKSQVCKIKQPERRREERESCVVCQDRPRSQIVLPCRHLCLCNDCCGQLLNRGAPCPLCRTHIVHSLQVYT